jgi:hypothetical protein
MIVDKVKEVLVKRKQEKIMTLFVIDDFDLFATEASNQSCKFSISFVSFLQIYFFVVFFFAFSFVHVNRYARTSGLFGCFDRLYLSLGMFISFFFFV